MASGEKKMVLHMSIAAHQLLSKLLRPKLSGHDWRSLADCMGFTYEDILDLECDMDPVVSIIPMGKARGATVEKLLLFLEKIERPDVIEDLEPFIESTLPSEYRKSDIKERRLSLELERLTVSDEIFDAFICYAKEDRSFAYKILTTLESPPFCRKICIDYRDYVPGNCRIDQTAKIIEHRCIRLIAILSPNFTSSSSAGFQVRIALNLSPDFQQRRVIPILYEECEIPEILRPIYYLNYKDLDDCERPHFWKRLASSLGYVPKGSPQVQLKGHRSPYNSPSGSPQNLRKINDTSLTDKNDRNKSSKEKKERSFNDKHKLRGFNLLKSRKCQ
ncbi:LOW QUALITY PROTEIN: myeloid differentiation primary response protein MyD88-like [Xenia sp. Carnegie-2017]|uniref:LOW QUALITY PROTEIN: myeloid differentiation primary response protein MyD88-like n=1 Tax=Xenia sp. Carnegie-2017 TaxID=2897299 RepID=UPI001F049808|nr:LOW QUALITY PROTEIN: myeloid differentiation primary response protein MyD88-like [Xenia sp. Carnegie-2017]